MANSKLGYQVQINELEAVCLYLAHKVTERDEEGDRIHEYCTKKSVGMVKSLEPVKGENYGVFLKKKQRWVRGKLKEIYLHIEYTEYKMFLIDRGDYAMVPISLMTVLPASMNYPPRCLRIGLDGVIPDVELCKHYIVLIRDTLHGGKVYFKEKRKINNIMYGRIVIMPFDQSQPIDLATTLIAKDLVKDCDNFESSAVQFYSQFKGFKEDLFWPEEEIKISKDRARGSSHTPSPSDIEDMRRKLHEFMVPSGGGTRHLEYEGLQQVDYATLRNDVNIAAGVLVHTRDGHVATPISTLSESSLAQKIIQEGLPEAEGNRPKPYGVFLQTKVMELRDIDKYAGLLFFGTEDGYVDSTAKRLDERLHFLSDYKSASKSVGSVWCWRKSQDYYVYSLIVQTSFAKNKISFTVLENICRELMKICKVDDTTHLGLECLAEWSDNPLFTGEMVTMLRHILFRPVKQLWVCFKNEEENKFKFNSNLFIFKNLYK